MLSHMSLVRCMLDPQDNHNWIGIAPITGKSHRDHKIVRPHSHKQSCIPCESDKSHPIHNTAPPNNHCLNHTHPRPCTSHATNRLRRDSTRHHRNRGAATYILDLRPINNPAISTSPKGLQRISSCFAYPREWKVFRCLSMQIPSKFLGRFAVIHDP